MSRFSFFVLVLEVDYAAEPRGSAEGDAEPKVRRA